MCDDTQTIYKPVSESTKSTVQQATGQMAVLLLLFLDLSKFPNSSPKVPRMDSGVTCPNMLIGLKSDFS